MPPSGYMKLVGLRKPSIHCHSRILWADPTRFFQMIWPREFNRVGRLSGPVPSLFMSILGFAAMLKLAFTTYATASRAERGQVLPLILSGNLFLLLADSK